MLFFFSQRGGNPGCQYQLSFYLTFKMSAMVMLSFYLYLFPYWDVIFPEEELGHSTLHQGHRVPLYVPDVVCSA